MFASLEPGIAAAQNLISDPYFSCNASCTSTSTNWLVATPADKPYSAPHSTAPGAVFVQRELSLPFAAAPSSLTFAETIVQHTLSAGVYTFSFYAKGNAAGVTADYSIGTGPLASQFLTTDNNSGGLYFNSATTSTSYQLVSFTFSLASSTSNLTIYLSPDYLYYNSGVSPPGDHATFADVELVAGSTPGQLLVAAPAPPAGLMAFLIGGIARLYRARRKAGQFGRAAYWMFRQRTFIRAA